MLIPKEDAMEADFSVLMAAVKIGRIQDAPSTAVLAKPTGTSVAGRVASARKPGRGARKKRK